METITSPKNDTVKLIRSLRLKKHRAETGLFVAEGKEVLARARGLKWIPHTLVTREGADGRELMEWCAQTKARCLVASASVFESLGGQENPTECLALFQQRWLDDVPKPLSKGLWIALQEIRDPGNLGTIIRTADAVSANGIILAGNCCDPYSPEAVRATMGSIFALPLMKIGIGTAAALLKTWPGETIGTAAGAAKDFRRAYRLPAILVMGSEGSGLAPELASACETLARIPMPGGTESLNIATAAALMMYEIRWQSLA